MRIVSGKFKARPLLSPSGRATRPTSDRARQAIFNILEHAPWLPVSMPEDALVLDVYAGTGALGLEALSRGAAHAAFIENNPAALSFCQRNIESFGLGEQAAVLRMDATRPHQRPPILAPRTLVFLDPPYGKGLGGLALAALAEKDWLAPDAVCVMEMSKKQPEGPPAGFVLADTRIYGIAEVRFLIWRDDSRRA